MGTLAIAQYTRSIVSGGGQGIEASHDRARRLALGLALVATFPVVIVVVVICLKGSLSLASTTYIAGVIAASAIVRQVTAVEIWMAKVAYRPGPALRVGVALEMVRFCAFVLIALTGNIYVAVLGLLACDVLLLGMMLKLGKKSRHHAQPK